MPGKENETLNSNNFKKIGQCLLSFMQILSKNREDSNMLTRTKSITYRSISETHRLWVCL